MKRDISDIEFDKLSKEKQKQYIAKLIIGDSRAKPVLEPRPPVAIVMAGLPGAGKTEFLDTLSEIMSKQFKFEAFVRIDLDQIVTVYPEYTPQRYAKFRSQANYALARCIDMAKNGRYNMMIDGTFAGTSDSSINNISRLLDSGYVVSMFYMHDDPKTAWSYTQSRETETKRGIDLEGFLKSSKNIPLNLKSVLNKFKTHERFSLSVVVQKELRDKDYRIVNDLSEIDNIIDRVYNMDISKETL